MDKICKYCKHYIAENKCTQTHYTVTKLTLCITNKFSKK